MRKPLSLSPAEWKDRAGMTSFMSYETRTCGGSIGSNADERRWSVERIPPLRATVWDFVGTETSRRLDFHYAIVLDLRE